MPSKIEFTYGSRLRNAQQMLNFVQTYPNYNPPRPEESIAELTTLLQDINTLNTEETTLKQNYSTATTARAALHKTAPNSISKLLAPIRGHIFSQYGKNSLEFKQINTLVAKIREGRLLHTVAADKVTELKLSQSQKSYGSQSKLFADIIATLTTFNNYTPSNSAIEIPQLQAVYNQTISLSDNVTLNYQRFIYTNKNRAKIYAELSDRAQRVKHYIKSAYGTQSLEYTLISSLSI